MIPRYGEWDARYRDRGLSVIGVHSPETEIEADPRQVDAFVRAHGIAWRVALDPYLDAFRRYGVAAWPTLLLIDRGGVVRSYHIGEDDPASVERDLLSLLGARP